MSLIYLVKVFVAIYYIKSYYDHYNIKWVLRIFNWIRWKMRKGESNLKIITLEGDGEWEKIDS